MTARGGLEGAEKLKEVLSGREPVQYQKTRLSERFGEVFVVG